jgi:MarR family transcriptional regulator for hemolysin
MTTSPNAAPHELGQILMLAAQSFQQRLDEDLQQRGVRGINARQRAVFLHLGRFGASRSVDLAGAAGIRPQSMMKIIHELEDLGLLERRPDPADSRAKLIDFTEQGRQFIEELTASTLTVWRQYQQIIGEQQLRQTMTTLKQLTELSAEDPKQ